MYECNMKNNNDTSILLEKAQQQVDNLQKEINLLQVLLNELKLSEQELPTTVPSFIFDTPKDEKETPNIQSFQSSKPQKENKDGYSFGDRVQITSDLSYKRYPFVQGFVPKKNIPRKPRVGTVVGTTLHYVDILLDNATVSIRKKNTSISLRTKS